MTAARTFIKICGITTPGAVDAALAAEVDAIGFVFAPSVRQVDTRRATELARPARHRVASVAVTRHPTQAAVDEILREFKPDILQTDIEDLEALELPRELAVLPVMRSGESRACLPAQRVLFEGPVSGSGRTADWDAAAELARDRQVILAGGLDPGNVGDALRRVQPFGVDVSSGVESSPGIKSVEKIGKFVAAVRGAQE